MKNQETKKAKKRLKVPLHLRSFRLTTMKQRAIKVKCDLFQTLEMSVGSSHKPISNFRQDDK